VGCDRYGLQQGAAPVMNYRGVEIGAVLAGRYRIDRVLGQGGMGIVVQAMHLQLHQPVAMKFLLPEVLGNQQVVQRFLREAQAAVRLRSEHVARVIDVGTLETGAPYMVLEYLDGCDLANFPRAQLSVGGVVDLMLQACEALAEAHSLGIVHRDIKPANFFIIRGPDGSPQLKVLDFGISKAPSAQGNLTATQSVMGTPAYMSPEQMRSSRDVDHRSDIWALGIVLYELLQGMPPFGGETFSSMVLKVVNDPLPRLTVRLPGDLDAIVYRCLEKDPARRYQNIAELAQALAAYAQSETQAAISVQRTSSIMGTSPSRPVIDPGTGQRKVPSTISGAAGARTMPPAKRRWPIFASLGVIAAVVGIAIVASTGGGSTSGKTDGPGTAPAGQPSGMDPATPSGTTPSGAPSGTTAGTPAGTTQPGTTAAGTTAAGTTPAGTTPSGAAPAGTAPAGVTPPGTAPAGATGPTPDAPGPALSGTSPTGTTPPVATGSGDAAANTPSTPDAQATAAKPSTGKTPDTASPSSGAKKPKPSKPTPAKPETPKPQAQTDDDVLGTRK
jgi:eukaryotic-like serine/threonine-protein kinase